MKKKDLQRIIRKDLKLDELNEAYMASPKVFDINTEMMLEKTKTAHNELYHKYVDSLNDVSAHMDSVDRKQVDATSTNPYRSTKLLEQYNLNAVYLHELFFANIGDPYSEVSMDSKAHMRITRDFGTFDDWQRDFIACAHAAREGGWAVTCLNTFLQRYVNIIIDGHDGHIPLGCYPVIALDMWEHSRRDYLNRKHEYIVAMMRELNWNVIEERFKRADNMLKCLQ